ncbi:B12-binding domain-containing radical SAM protein [Candidatus Parcubacteria bacterium]|jgi:anaerobic magnesium-protoporphyrin IX monomethyl ester cyclase|nr:B12-binding domain-containing radical SAM protein [Candidatus Parcubacteria bacterium]MBT7228371.1 B12-binding domain-containing radical SAM protein [Candidatus Parcubacteria bacterium]
MEKLNIVGIEAKSSGLHVYSKHADNPRTGLPRLLTPLDQLGHNCKIYCEELPDSRVDWDIVAEAHIVMISSITSTAPRAYDLARRVREVNPRATILGGGPHFTFEYQEALENGIDFVFLHWADISFFEWLDWYQSLLNPCEISAVDLEALHGIRGLAFMIANHPHKTKRPVEVDPDTWPTPDFRLVQGYKPKFIVLITSEGCDHNCEFCSIWAMYGAKYRARSTDKVIEDIRFYRELYGNIPIFVGDDNMAADTLNLKREIVVSGEDRLRNICQGIIDAGLHGSYSCQVRLALGDHPELLDLMAQAGFDRACIGYESVEPENFKATDGKLDFDRMEEQTAAFHRHGIAIHAMWVLGFAADTVDTVKKTLKLCMKWKIETNQFMILVPIPGSPLRKRLLKQGRVLHNDWEKYDGRHVVFEPELIGARELQVAVVLDAMPKIYNLFQTFRIYLDGNMRTLGRCLSHRAPHPRIEFKSHLGTLAMRLVGFNTVRRVKKDTLKYLETLRRFSKSVA